MLDACDDSGQRWLVHHDDLLKAVVLLGEMLGVDWEDGYGSLSCLMMLLVN